jgi:CheY-like chemotaxis protein
LSLALLGRLCHVETAATSWEAIKKIKERPFDIAVVDAELPSTHGLAMTGWDVARILRAFNPALAIVVVTAEKGPEAQTQADRLGISKLVEKPISPRELRAFLQTLEPGSAIRRQSAGR